MKDVWTLKYRPDSFDGILGNRQTVETLKSLTASGTLPHMILFGPDNSGKITAALALANRIYGNERELNFTYFNASDFFEQGKNYLVRDPRFYRILGTDDPKKIQKSVINVFKDIINEYAAIAPMNADYKIICIDSAEALTMEAQQALRRIMEKYSKTCRFILSSKSISKIIPPLRSRGVTLFFSPVASEELVPFMQEIVEKEGFSVKEDVLFEIAYQTHGNVGDSLEVLQTALLEAQEINTELTVSMIQMQFQLEGEDGTMDLFNSTVYDKNFMEARNKLDTLLIDDGLTGSEILEGFENAVWVEEKKSGDEMKTAKRLIQIADCDSRLAQASNERIQLENLIANFDNE
ncbi:AAA family ATPase [Methanimicrococcus blatticola]|uniref:Replication factor C small subunit n=1 Tax=Methanimicrococcus blatticola TaxID=91560 RepID=A0A484F3I1_9EURY|nr:AAA family ATPase [Methanimicrococcus blatticola]MBZ3935337.1 AAA family ATPase [Methanimicrococcus blatticola]MCC2508565.1 AAA family ATPase [Methanimicrococcus blatticola]TDQ67873.1 replication factor C small subunit [Methanimicrococcus blatticola]